MSFTLLFLGLLDEMNFLCHRKGLVSREALYAGINQPRRRFGGDSLYICSMGFIFSGSGLRPYLVSFLSLYITRGSLNFWLSKLNVSPDAFFSSQGLFLLQIQKLKTKHLMIKVAMSRNFQIW